MRKLNCRLFAHAYVHSRVFVKASSAEQSAATIAIAQSRRLAHHSGATSPISSLSILAHTIDNAYPMV